MLKKVVHVVEKNIIELKKPLIDIESVDIENCLKGSSVKWKKENQAHLQFIL